MSFRVSANGRARFFWRAKVLAAEIISSDLVSLVITRLEALTELKRTLTSLEADP